MKVDNVVVGCAVMSVWLYMLVVCYTISTTILTPKGLIIPHVCCTGHSKGVIGGNNPLVRGFQGVVAPLYGV